ncbi:sister chromatid cohesion 1 protein 3 [Ricinus communis]|uniref:sister chromatid cohesion 1 protein 3 n=1 Tax=Ricinus communis TaxID=3988 RepID=UPI000772CBED|nr:sister chromatid cohesion 1 protein 3 [Ricinus communis]|eukprot:XP_015571019.1 sister chromatid cohesion 1 protein 3 [Ricinus communis]
MFYSQTFLARKGPLGTVWCAAHLQHRLKKSHYTSTDISSTVDRIMFPEVPIALRMSGHLLLGVVRIYSKKVDFLYHDCNVVLVGLRKAFTSIEVNLPENATTAKFESVTLPPTFDLDALDVDFDIDAYGSPDNHMRSQEEITLQDQIPTDRDPYVVISFDEDVMMDTLPPEEELNAGIRPTEDIVPPSGVDTDMASPHTIPSSRIEVTSETVDLQDSGPTNLTEVLMDFADLQETCPSNKTELQTQTLDFQEPGPSNQTEVLNSAINNDNFPPEIEVLRDHVDVFSSENLPPVFTHQQNDASEPNISLDQGLNEKKTPSPFKEDVIPSGGQSSPFQQRSESPNSASRDAPGIFDSHISFGRVSPELAIRSTPAVQQPRPRTRKRKHFFDEATVLTNKFMKKALENSKDILRKRREIPSTALGIWKLRNSLRKEQVLSEPLLTGSCADLCNLLKDYISGKPHLTLEREVTPEPRVTTSAPAIEVIPEWRDATSPARSTVAILESIAATSPTSATEMISESRTTTSPAPATENIPEPMFAQPSVPEVEPDLEIERLRQHEGHDANILLPELLPSPGRFPPSPFRRDDFTPNSMKSLGSETAHWAGTSAGTEVLPTPDIAASTGTYTTDLETPRTFLEEQFDAGHTGLSDIPEFVNTAEAEDLYFLEADNSPAGSPGSQGIDSLSVRTRAVAQYLKRNSPITPVSEDLSGDLSLNRILQGKTRKLCARMFFETLVLKSYGLIDVRQEEPYGDIALKLTSRLSKAQI